MKKIFHSLAIISACYAVQATAEEPAGYIFGGLGQASYDVDGDSDSATSFGLGGGYKINENFAIEFRYDDFGEIEDSFSEGGDSVSVSFSASALALSLKAGIPANETLFLYARVGFSLWDVEASVRETFGGNSASATGSNDGNDLHFGFGAEFAASETVSLGADYTMLAMDLDGLDLDISNLSLFVSYSF